MRDIVVESEWNRSEEAPPANKAGILPGDILVGIQRWETTSLRDLTSVFELITQTSSEDNVKFYILRNGQTIWGHMTIPNFKARSGSKDTSVN
jgi:S1-C subfamily serine protease